MQNQRNLHFRASFCDGLLQEQINLPRGELMMVFVLNSKRRLTYPGIRGEGPSAVHNNDDNDNEDDHSMVTHMKKAAPPD